MPDRLVHLQLLARDATALSGFYRALLDWRITPARISDPGSTRSGPYLWADNGSDVDAGFADEPDVHGIVPMVEVQDLEQRLRRCHDLGGRRLSEPAVFDLSGAPRGNGRLRGALVADPEGNRIALTEPG